MIFTSLLILPTAFAFFFPYRDTPTLTTFPIKSRFPTLEPHALVTVDRLRVKNKVRRALGMEGVTLSSRADAISIEALNIATGYTVNISVGNPSTDYNVLVDTGSSNTWVGNNKPFVPTSTSHQTENNVSVTYGSGSMSGVEYLDQVSLGSNLTITNQSVGVAQESRGLPVDGILGLGPFDLSIGTLIPDVAVGVHTPTENLASQGTIPANLLGVSFSPTNDPTVKNGELTFGQADCSKHVGNITYTNIPKNVTASRFWGISQSVNYGNTQVLQNSTGFFDTGTTLILLNTTAYNTYKNVTGAKYDPTIGLLSITHDQFKSLQPLVFNIGGMNFELVPDAQIWPRSLNTIIGGESNSTYLIVSDLGDIEGAHDLHFVLGYTFLERFYTLYDGSNNRIGIANMQYTNVTVN